MRTPLVALLVLGSSLAGCLGSTTESMPDDQPRISTTRANNTTFVNPDGTRSAAANETPRTVVGGGGIEHQHDYWKGETSAILFDGPVNLNDAFFCDNRDTNKLGCALLKLPVAEESVLVYEGANRMEVTVTGYQPWVLALEMRYKNGAFPEWGELIPLQPGTPASIDISPTETDMPHAWSSQWAWKFIGNKASPQSWFAAHRDYPDFNVKIEVFKGSKVLDWPGHPDFYADKTHRVVMDKDGVTRNAGAHDQYFYGDEANIVRPDLLISSGTGNLTLYLNITGTSTTAGEIKPDLYYIDYTNATGYWNGDYTEWNRAVNRLIGQKVDDTHYIMTLPVKHTGWDSPYAPTSGWQFLVRPGYQAVVEGRGVRLSPQMLPYDVSFHLTIIATPDPKYLGSDALGT